MTKGYIQLSFTGKQDYKLIGNPQICFWKKVYKQHTNFSSQSIEIECDDSIQMAEDKKTVYRFKIKRYGDMVNFISLTLDLPEITTKGSGSVEYFKWITNIGANVIETARLYYDDILIEEIDGDFILINKDMNYTSAQAETFNKLIGNIPEIYTPVTNNIIYPCRLNIPLPFCFFRNKTNIPLLCNTLREVFVEITLRPINDIYLIGSVHYESLISPSPYSGGTCGPGVGSGQGSCITYIKWEKQTGCGNIINYSKQDTIKPTLEVNYIYLDNDERNSISQKPFTQILPYVKKTNFNELIGKVKLYIDEFHPLKTLYIIAKKNNVSCINQWDNYTNKDYSEQNILLLQSYLLSYIKNEANETNYSFVKLLGGLLKYDMMGSSFKAKPDYRVCVNENGGISDIKLFKRGDHIHKPLLKIISDKGKGAKLKMRMKLKKIIIKSQGDNYMSEPIILSSNKNLTFKARIKDRKISEILIIGNTIVDEIPSLSVIPTCYINKINHTDFGQNYISSPYVIVYFNKNTPTILFKGEIQNGKIVSSRIIFRSPSPNNCNETEASVFIGGFLNNIIPEIENFIYDDDYNMPSLYFYDKFNKILSPDVIIDDNILITNSRGAGLTKYTSVHIGNILSNIKSYNNELFKQDNISLHLGYKYYVSGVSPEIKCTTKPTIKYSLPNITGILPKYSLDLKQSYMFNNEKHLYPNVNSIFKSVSIKNNNLIVEYEDKNIDNKNLLLELQLHTISSSDEYCALKRFLPNTSLINIPIKLILNHSKDITEYVNDIHVFSYNLEKLYTTLFITYKNGNIRSLPDILKEGDIITLLINDIYINTCTIKIFNELKFGWDTSPQANVIDIVMNGLGLYFGGFNTSPFEFDIVRSIDDFKMISNGFDISTKPTVYIKSNTHMDIPVEFNIDLPLITNNDYELDHGGYGAECAVEFDFGGTIKQLNNYVDVTIDNGKVQSVEFNSLYTDTVDSWNNYAFSPLFIYKSKLITASHLSKHGFNDYSKIKNIREHGILDICGVDSVIELYEDALIGGIIDMGGAGFEGNIIYDNGGFGARLILEKIGNHKFNIKCSNMGYNYIENIISSLVAYNIDLEGKLSTRIVCQFKSNINNIGQIDTSKKYLNNKFNKIYITHDILDDTPDDIYNIVDSKMNMGTKYFIVTGYIPDRSINIIHPGDNYGHDMDNTLNNDNTLEFKLSSHPEFLDKAGIKCEYDIINNCIDSITIISPSDIIIPFVEYIYDYEKGIHFKKLDGTICSKSKLTGFKVIDSGNGIYNHDEMYFYNGFITELSVINKGSSYTLPPKVYLSDKENKISLHVELEKTMSQPDIGSSLLRVSYPDKHKLFVINQKGHYILSKYKNISQKPLPGNKFGNYVFFNDDPVIIIGGEITRIELSTNNIEDIAVLSYNNRLRTYIEDNIYIKEKKGSSYTIESALIHSDSSKILTKTSFHDLEILKIYKDIGYTRASYIDIGYPINKLDIVHLGDEIDESTFGYDIVVLNKHNERIHRYFSPKIIMKGNNNPIKGNTYSINIQGDGGGHGATGEVEIIKGTGAKLIAMANIDSFNIVNPGKDYTCTDIVEIDNSFYEWSSIKECVDILPNHLMTKKEISEFLNIWSLRDNNNIPIIDTKEKYEFYSSDIIKTLGIIINNEVREELRSAYYYKTVEKFFTSPNSNYNNILEYSASLNNIKFQPMGSINLETLNKFAVVLELLNPTRFESYKYDVSIFTISYNIIKYINGIGSLVYGN